MSKFVEKKLSEIIDLKQSITNNSRFTKSFIDTHKGDIPVYGASQIENDVSYGYVADNLIGIKYFNNCLTWNIDGSTAIFYRKDYFSLSEKVIPLILFKNLNQLIDLDYLRYAIIFSPDFSSFNFTHKAGKNKLGNLRILLPVNLKGFFDPEEQQRLAGIYSEIENKKQILLNRIYEIDELLIHINKENNIQYKDIPLLTLFTLKNGNSIFTKTYTNNHQGQYPLYSANTDKIYAYINSFDYDGDYLTWAKDGLAGYIMVHQNEKFSITGHRSILIPYENTKNISLLYVKYYLEPIFRNLKKGRIGQMGANEYTTLNLDMIKRANIQIPIPICSDGSYDIKKQKEIVDKYMQIDEIKQGLIDKIQKLISINIIPENS